MPNTVRAGNTVTIRATVLSNQYGDGWFKAEISGDTYKFHKSQVAFMDPRPFFKDDIVESSIGKKPDQTAVVIEVADDTAWVRWDTNEKTIESVTHLKLLKAASGMLTGGRALGRLR